jgi:hypothetical protein
MLIHEVPQRSERSGHRIASVRAHRFFHRVFQCIHQARLGRRWMLRFFGRIFRIQEPRQLNVNQRQHPENHVGLGRQDIIETQDRVPRKSVAHRFLLKLNCASGRRRDFLWQQRGEGVLNRHALSHRHRGAHHHNPVGSWWLWAARHTGAEPGAIQFVFDQWSFRNFFPTRGVPNAMHSSRGVI